MTLRRARIEPNRNAAATRGRANTRKTDVAHAHSRLHCPALAAKYFGVGSVCVD